MINKLKKRIRSKLSGSFEIEEQVLRQFCEKNEKLWEDRPHNGGALFIGLFMVEKWTSWLIPKMLYAKGIEQKENVRPIVIDWESNEALKDFYRSYGIGFISLKEEMLQDPAGFFCGLWRALCFLLFQGSGSRLVKLKFRNNGVGHFMYDTIIRTNQDIYTIRNARNKIVFKKILTSFWSLHTLDRICRRNPPRYYLFDDLVYDEGMFIKLFQSYGTKVCKCANDGTVIQQGPEKPVFWPDLDRAEILKRIEGLSGQEREEYAAEADRLLEGRFQGKNGDKRDSKAAFTGKKLCTKEELVSFMGLDPKKKNIVICSHTLSENTHRCGKQAYEDTYTWMEETMRMVRNDDSANWIVKVHPVAGLKYGEAGVLEGLFQRYKSENLFLFPDEYNSSLVGQLADVIVTIYGTVGGEYSCLGIPVILAGRAAYSGFDFTVDAFTPEKYAEALKNAAKLPRLTHKQQKTAKLIFTCFNKNKTHELGILGGQIADLIWKQEAVYMAGESMEGLNSEILSMVMEFMEKNDIIESEYFRNGTLVE